MIDLFRKIFLKKPIDRRHEVQAITKPSAAATAAAISAAPKLT